MRIFATPWENRKFMRQKLLLTINSLRSGGAERVVSQLLVHLQNDFEIHLALYNNIVEYDIPATIKIIDLKQSESENQLLTLLKLPVLSYRLAKYCRQNGITHSVAFLNRPCYLNAMMKNWWGYKGRIVMCERTYQTSMIQTKGWLGRIITRILLKYSYKTADLVLANSEVIKTDLRQNLDVTTPIKVIYNPVDISEVKTKMNEPVPVNFQPGLFYFVSVGNFKKGKNHALLLHAFALIKNPDCRLLLIGSGILEKETRQLAEELGISSQVIFCGRDNNPFKYMQHCDCFVMSSDVEGFPNVLLEAIACGMPAISTDCFSGPRELLAPGTDLSFQLKDNYSEEAYGILTATGNINTLAAAMKKMVDDKDLRERLRKNASSRAPGFDVKIIKTEFLQAFSSN